MARIEIQRMKRTHKTSTRLHDVVAATYDIYEIGGQKILHIDTYGRPEREYTDKISQTIQLDETNIKSLVELLKEHNIL